MRPEFVLVLVYLSAGHLERNRLVGLGGKQQILPLFVRRLNALLVGGHESVARRQALHYLRIINLKEQTLLLGIGTPLLGDLVAGSADFDKLSYVNVGLGLRGGLSGRFGLFLGRTPRQIRLMLLALRVRQIAALIVVQRETQLALVGAQMIAHKVGILEYVDGLEGELAQTLASVLVCLACRGDPA